MAKRVKAIYFALACYRSIYFRFGDASGQLAALYLLCHQQFALRRQAALFAVDPLLREFLQTRSVLRIRNPDWGFIADLGDWHYPAQFSPAPNNTVLAATRDSKNHVSQAFSIRSFYVVALLYYLATVTGTLSWSSIKIDRRAELSERSWSPAIRMDRDLKRGHDHVRHVGLDASLGRSPPAALCDRASSIKVGGEIEPEDRPCSTTATEPTPNSPVVIPPRGRTLAGAGGRAGRHRPPRRPARHLRGRGAGTPAPPFTGTSGRVASTPASPSTSTPPTASRDLSPVHGASRPISSPNSAVLYLRRARRRARAGVNCCPGCSVSGRSAPFGRLKADLRSDDDRMNPAKVVAPAPDWTSTCGLGLHWAPPEPRDKHGSGYRTTAARSPRRSTAASGSAGADSTTTDGGQADVPVVPGHGGGGTLHPGGAPGCCSRCSTGTATRPSSRAGALPRSRTPSTSAWPARVQDRLPGECGHGHVQGGVPVPPL